jgi:DNA-binding response OmpR family regulator
VIGHGPPATGLDLAGNGNGTALRVLVLESNGRTGGLVRQAAAQTGIAVDLAREPRMALRRLREAFYDVILIDLPAPGIQERELFTEISAIDGAHARRVVFLVNDLGDARTRRFLIDVGRPFLTQPADPAELSELVVRVGYGLDGPDGREPDSWFD